jgi:hypothetical protein
VLLQGFDIVPSPAPATFGIRRAGGVLFPWGRYTIGMPRHLELRFSVGIPLLLHALP